MSAIQYGVVIEIIFLVCFFIYKNFETTYAFILGIVLYCIVFILNKILENFKGDISCCFGEITKVNDIGCSPALIGISYGLIIYSVAVSPGRDDSLQKAQGNLLIRSAR